MNQETRQDIFTMAAALARAISSTLGGLSCGWVAHACLPSCDLLCSVPRWYAEAADCMVVPGTWAPVYHTTEQKGVDHSSSVEV